MDEDYISIGPGDEFTVAPDVDGYPAVRVQSAAFVEVPRWLLFGSVDGDQKRRIDQLIGALEQLRDQEPHTWGEN